MKNKLFPIFITFIFVIVFVIFYKGLKETNIYTPETKTNYEVPSLLVELFDTNEIVNTLEIFNSDIIDEDPILIIKHLKNEILNLF